MTIKIRVSKATSENAAYARMNDRVNSIEANVRKLENIIDVDGSSDTLVLNIGEDKIRLIFNDNKTVGWDYVNLKNESTISATSITFGKSITMTGKASGGTSPYTYKFEAKQSTHTNYSVLQDYSSTATKTWKPGSTATYSVRITVKDSKGNIAEKYIDLTVMPAEGDEPNSENPTIDESEG